MRKNLVDILVCPVSLPHSERHSEPVATDRGRLLRELQLLIFKEIVYGNLY